MYEFKYHIYHSVSPKASLVSPKQELIIPKGEALNIMHALICLMYIHTGVISARVR